MSEFVFCRVIIILKTNDCLLCRSFFILSLLNRLAYSIIICISDSAFIVSQFAIHMPHTALSHVESWSPRMPRLIAYHLCSCQTMSVECFCWFQRWCFCWRWSSDHGKYLCHISICHFHQ